MKSYQFSYFSCNKNQNVEFLISLALKKIERLKFSISFPLYNVGWKSELCVSKWIVIQKTALVDADNSVLDLISAERLWDLNSNYIF